MTTLQLGQRLCGYLTAENLNEMSAAETALLVDAINVGLGEMKDHLPAHRFTSEVSFAVAAPRSETVTMTTGAVEGNFTTPELADIGKTFVFADDPAPNALVSVVSLARAYRGAGGSVLATLYDDAIAFDYNDESVGRSLFFTQASNGRRSLLSLCDARPASAESGTSTGVPTHCWVEGYAPEKILSDVDLPREPYTQLANMIAGAWVLKLCPLPSEAGFVEVSLKSFDRGVLFSDLIRARTFRFSPIESAHLVSLCAEALLAGGKLAAHVSRADVVAAAKLARAWLRRQTTSRTHGSDTLETSPGF